MLSEYLGPLIVIGLGVLLVWFVPIWATDYSWKHYQGYVKSIDFNNPPSNPFTGLVIIQNISSIVTGSRIIGGILIFLGLYSMVKRFL